MSASSVSNLTLAQAINDALSVALAIDPKVICYGLGTDDPKGIFGTTLGLQSQFGSDRVFDMPTSENAMTGVAIGASMNGIRPVMCHQRLDFFLLALDQLVNHAAKWHYMFGGKQSIPMTLRLIMGRGWGQGPTHAQNLQSWFAHIPGLKVVMPTTPYNAKGLLLSSIFDPNPVVFLEHRWLHEMQGEVPAGDYRIPLGKAEVLSYGNDLTVISLSYMTIEAIHALDSIRKEGFSVELIDLQTISPLDWHTLMQSVKKTGRVLVLDTGHATCSIASEIIARISMELFLFLKAPPKRITLPDFPSPTSPALSQSYYPRAEDILLASSKLLGHPLSPELLQKERSHSQGWGDVPGSWFKGPF